MTTTTTAAHEALVAAVDGLIWAALSSAGSRILTKPSCPRSERGKARGLVSAEVHVHYPVEPDNIDQYRLLDGAWVRVPEIAARYGFDPGCMTHALDEYCRALITAREPHEFQTVPALLRMSSCVSEAA